VRIIDLSTPIDASHWEPNPVTHEVLTPRDAAQHMADGMRHNHGIEFDPAVLPGGEFLSLDTITLTTHTGTHVDAPSHYGSTALYGTPRHIDELPLDWFIGPGVLLDLTQAKVGRANTVDAGELTRQLDAIEHTPRAGDIVLLRTGADKFVGTPQYFTDFIGLDGSSIDLLLDLGIRVVGTDAFSLDAPFTAILDTYQRTGDDSVLWPAHFAGRRREYCQIERLTNLDALPAATGFVVSCLPVKIAGAGAGWSRTVAIIDNETP
jgi:cyclase